MLITFNAFVFSDLTIYFMPLKTKVYETRIY